MRTIELEAAGWTTILNFCDALLVAIGIQWHGRNLIHVS
jgi:hypothetical protein